MRVAVVQGGPSREAAVSRASGRAVHGALQTAGHAVHQFELDASLPQRLVEYAPEVVFPAVHGTQGEDGCLQGLLEVMRIPYVGSDVRSSALCADKVASKLFFREAGLPVARERVFAAKDVFNCGDDALKSLRRDLGDQLIVKPAQGGSTIGMSRLLASASNEHLLAALRLALEHDSSVLVEELIEGREVTCAVLEQGSGPRPLPVTLIISEATEWYDFESKYAPGGSLHICPAPLDPELSARIQAASLQAHCLMGARDFSRCDFIIDQNGTPILLELNTLPGLTEVSLFPEAARAEGLEFSVWADKLLYLALDRAPGEPILGQEIPLK